MHRRRMLNILVAWYVVPALLALGLTYNVVSARQDESSTVVLMLEYTYSPKTVTVTAGSSVTWRNAGNEPHTATLPGVFDTGSVPPGGESSVTFSQVGTFRYFDTVFGGPTGEAMNGTVVVTEAVPADPEAGPAAPGATPGMPEVGNSGRPLTFALLSAGALILAGLAVRRAR